MKFKFLDKKNINKNAVINVAAISFAGIITISSGIAFPFIVKDTDRRNEITNYINSQTYISDNKQEFKYEDLYILTKSNECKLCYSKLLDVVHTSAITSYSIHGYYDIDSGELVAKDNNVSYGNNFPMTKKENEEYIKNHDLWKIEKVTTCLSEDFIKDSDLDISIVNSEYLDDKLEEKHGTSR